MQTDGPRSGLALGVVALIGLLLVAAAIWLRPGAGGQEPGTPPGVPDAADGPGTPSIAVDRTEVDEGAKAFDTPVRTVFRLRNAGDGVLRIAERPKVELAAGC